MSNSVIEEVADMRVRYDELFDAAVAAVKNAGWGIPQNHDDLLVALANMAIPTNQV
jgi:hypothetical protein